MASSQPVLATTSLINKSSPTIVAVWTLGSPSQSDTSKRIRLPKHAESLGAGGDRRSKSVKDSYMPSGKYRAICKLYMAYRELPGEEFIGTGWLIADDLIATAGHCLYDHQNSGGFLKYIKVYFGYAGPESVRDDSTVYRYGVLGSCPSEFLKAESDTHDVGFVRLNKSVNIDPLAYITTPNKVNLKMGVVGYPGDRDFGHYMYEHWQKVDIDLEKTSAVLNYKIDTTGGQSGSPVLWLDPISMNFKAIGVHIAGGYPNVGSTIGPVGNKFEEYSLALKVSEGLSSPSAEILTAATGSSVAPGFQMISIKPSLASESANGVNGQQNGMFNDTSNDDPAGNADKDDDVDLANSASQARAEAESALNALFGTENGSFTPKPSRSEIARGQFMKYPESLRLDESDSASPPAPPNYDAAVAAATENKDIQTVFFVNFPPSLQGTQQDSLKKLMESIKSWQSWSSTICEGKVQEQVDKKALPSDNSAESMMARSTYRSKVFDYIMRKSSWFAKTFDQNISKHIEVRKLEFHTAILTAVLEGFTVPTTVFSQLEKILSTISGGILEVGSNSSQESQQYWIMLTRYEYQPLTDTVNPIIRVISFQVSQTTKEYTFGKSKFTSVSFDLSFGQYQTDFNARIYEKIQASIDQKLVDMGVELVNQKTFDIAV